ncbi:sugar hydrolase [Streptomyces mashuensis]|uniref:chitinase n=1 Tax=Streptomyces mashuensis TaxID=33904 RepID=A0A919AWF1_9ACTN|nr:cellulose binding domain-containing protein [Streptomyces mashuensis]GHF28475.1 sugar hydrolase [Streptomyces mashuensis]
MGSSAHRRRTGRRTKAAGAVLAAAIATAAALTLTGTAQAASVGADFSTTSSWSGGYTGQYVVTNGTGHEVRGWKLTFDLPEGARITSLWNGRHTVSGRSVTVEPESWNATLAPGASAAVGFVVGGPGTAPTNCRIDGAKCSVDRNPEPRPTQQPTGRPTQQPTGQPTGQPGGAAARFAPYVDTSLYPAFDLTAAAEKTGVKHYTLAFVTSGGGCTPKWGGVTDLGNDAVAAQIGKLRAAGGDVRVSFGGAAGSELGLTCSSVDELAAAYGKVVDTYRLTKADFDIEGGALPDTAANTRRAKAIARLQQQHPGLDVSFTLPVMPTGLTQAGVDLVANAKQNGVAVSSVNVMAMDYGASFNGDMGQYAIDAATATQRQIKGVLGLGDAAAWKAVAVTPMIGVNDVASEVFTVQNATRLAAFAREKGLGWLSMWSATRDKPCPGGPQNSASATCSSIQQDAFAFTKAFAAAQRG